jgi:cytochrome b
MKPVLVWDLPIRIFHWLLSLCCLAAIALALGAPEHSRAFDFHMLLGLMLLPLIIFRLLWGLIGTRYSRFQSFLYRPRAAVDYLISVMTNNSKRYLGHNPAASFAILAMLILIPGSVISGLLMPGSEIFEELHEMLSFGLLAVIGAHLLGVLSHIVVHKENVVLSMLTGKKLAQENEGIPSAHSFVAFVLFVLVGGWSTALVKNYDFASKKLEVPVSGTVIQLGKSEKHGDKQEHDDD